MVDGLVGRITSSTGNQYDNYAVVGGAKGKGALAVGGFVCESEKCIYNRSRNTRICPSIKHYLPYIHTYCERCSLKSVYIEQTYKVWLHAFVLFCMGGVEKRADTCDFRFGVVRRQRRR